MLSLITLAILLMSTSVFSIQTTNVGNGEILKLAVVDDGWIEATTTNHNNDAFLSVAHRSGSGKKRALLKFEDITPSDCPVHKIRQASMYLHFEGEYKEGNSFIPEKYYPYQLQVHALKKQWVDTVVTGTKRTSDNDWAKNMVGILSNQDADVEPQACATNMYPLRPEGFVEFDVTSYVRELVANTRSNYGVAILATNEVLAGVDLRFTSEQASDASKHAYINVLCL